MLCFVMPVPPGYPAQIFFHDQILTWVDQVDTSYVDPNDQGGWWINGDVINFTGAFSYLLSREGQLWFELILNTGNGFESVSGLIQKTDFLATLAQGTVNFYDGNWDYTNPEGYGATIEAGSWDPPVGFSNAFRIYVPPSPRVSCFRQCYLQHGISLEGELF
jgi:hypothetical protein